MWFTTEQILVFFTSKTTVLLVASVALLFLLLNIEFPKSDSQLSQQQITTLNSFTDNNTFANPFFRSDGESKAMDSLPTITQIVPHIEPFENYDLRLHGIVYKRNNEGYAMISMHSAIQEIYTVNSEIRDRMVLNEISKSTVVIDYHGELYRLSIESSQRNKDFNSVKTISKNLAEEIATVKEDHRRNPIRLLMIRRPYPVYEDGRFLGYIVMPGSNEDQFNRLGFKSGDIITYLNGIPFVGPGKAEFVITELTHSRNIDLTVLRGEKMS